MSLLSTKHLSCQDIQTALTKLNIASECRECGWEKSVIPVEYERDQSGDIIETPELVSISSFLPSGEVKEYNSIIVICEKCGHVRSFLAQNLCKILGYSPE